MRFTARRYDTAEIVEVEIAGERISAIVPRNPSAAPQTTAWVAPGFVDLQVNGFGGQDFNDLNLTGEHVNRISRALDRHGVTAYCPTATTHSFEVLAHTLSTIAEAIERDAQVARRAIGIHLEGPYISRDDGPRGAHPKQFVRPPDWEEFQRLQDAACGRIKILTMSPEYENSADFVSRVTNTRVVVAIGHTSSDADQIRAAVDAGARLSTHLGNGAHGQIRRHPNYIWDQLADDRLTASLIADGFHLPPAVLKTFVRAKTPARCILVSDITGMAGMPPGRYENSSLGDIEVLDDGRLAIAGQRQLLAGAALPIGVGIANIVRHTDADLKTAVEMAANGPRELLALPTADLTVGAPADLVLFEFDPAAADASITIVATINRGELVYDSSSAVLKAAPEDRDDER